MIAAYIAPSIPEIWMSGIDDGHFSTILPPTGLAYFLQLDIIEFKLVRDQHDNSSPYNCYSTAYDCPSRPNHDSDGTDRWRAAGED
jgi:hypothetical protein